jgi:protocatechuate 3,4-dioxygenase beta subunit
MRRTLSIAYAGLAMACSTETAPTGTTTEPHVPVIAPASSPRVSVGPASSSDTGTVIVSVRANGGAPVAGARVELGSWDGAAQAFRDSTIGGVLLPRPDDARFHVLAITVTDNAGRVAFTGIEKKQLFAVRAMPASGGTGAYFPSLLWLYTSPTMELGVRLPR